MILSRETAELRDPRVAYEHLKRILAKQDKFDQDKEHFFVIILNARNRVKVIELISVGTLNASLVHPREVFRLAIHRGASSIIIAHNHPSGNPEPSAVDLEVTHRLVQAGKLIGIEVVDHIIIGKNSFRSAIGNN
jgi:DNA repair protein RadC